MLPFLLTIRSAPFTSFSFLGGNLLYSVLDGKNAIWLGPSKALLIEQFNESRKRSFPWFLTVVGQPTQLPRVHTQFTGHLNLRMGEVKLSPRIDPPLQLFRYSLFIICHRFLPVGETLLFSASVAAGFYKRLRCMRKVSSPK